MKILVVDSDLETGLAVSHFLKNLQLQESISVVNATGCSELREILGNQKISVIFYSDDVPDVTNFFSLRASQLRVPIVKIVSSADDCLEVQDFDPVGFLKKPLDVSSFVKLLQKLQRQDLSPSSCWKSVDYLFVKEKGVIERIDLADLIFVEAQGNYCSFQTKSSKSFLKAFSLQDLQPQLPSGFKRVHRSYIVNLSLIERVANQTIYLAGGVRIPVGKSYQQMLNRALGCA